MARYTGKEVYIRWVYSGGTVELNTDFRSIEENQEMQAADQTAGPDDYTSELPMRVTNTVSVELLDNDSAAGQNIWAALKPGTQGTLTWGPLGTATGQPRRDFPCFVRTRTRTLPFDDVVSIRAEFAPLGDITDSTW